MSKIECCNNMVNYDPKDISISVGVDRLNNDDSRMEINSTTESLPSLDSAMIGVVTHDGNIIYVKMWKCRTILELRNEINKWLHIPLGKWKLFSQGGKLLWDNRTLLEHNFSGCVTLNVRLSLKGGGKSNKTPEQKQPKLKSTSLNLKLEIIDKDVLRG